MHFFIDPTINCNSNCSYCYSKKEEGCAMTRETLIEAVSFIKRSSEDQTKTKTSVTFHGGEPLLAEPDFYPFAIPYIKEQLGCDATISVQSNLWLVDETLCKLFKQYNVGTGTSLDGPQDINDHQRSAGYFSKTLAGIELLKKQGLSCGCIATFTKQSSEKLEEIFNFFIAKGLYFDVHSAIKPIAFPDSNKVFLSPQEFGEMIIRLLDMYVKHLPELKIGTLDTLIKNVANKQSGLCTFTRCLGEYYAISPEGDLYTCNRFVGNKDFCIGNIRDIHSFSDIIKSEAWKKQQAWQDWIDVECRECLFKEYCHGGCPYTAFASGNGSFVKDPHCEAYKMIYHYIIDKGAAEFFSPENLATLNQDQNSTVQAGFQINPILYLMKDYPHPVDMVQAAKKIITAALLGKTGNPKQTIGKLFELGVVNSIEEKLPLIEQFYHELIQPSQGFNNLYLHITGSCNLRCSYCYSYLSDEINSSYLPQDLLIKNIIEAKAIGFRKIIFTGGEPLLHPGFESLTNAIINLRQNQKLPTLVLRTNFTIPLTSSLIRNIGEAFDQVIISIDGSENNHDRQRGQGAYQKTMNNIRLFDNKVIEKKLAFACVLNQKGFSGSDIEKEKHMVNSLKEEFPVKEIRFTPLLPIGRGRHLQTQRMHPEPLTVIEWMKRKYYIRTSCGLGQSLMIDTDGAAYPCHVLKETEKQNAGNICDENLKDITKKDAFTKLRNINVNTDNKCRHCEMKYLCGGVCRIWENQDCFDLYKRATHLLSDALKICNVSHKALYRMRQDYGKQHNEPANSVY